MDYIYDRQALLGLLKQVLSEEKYRHTLGCEKQALLLARKHGADERKAGLAALLHDVTKCMDNRALREKYGLPASLPEKTLHAFTGAEYVKEHGVTDDEEVISAVRWHTTGRENMSLLEKIVYLADATEENRDYRGVEALRKLAERDLNAAMLRSLAATVENLARLRLPIQQATIQAYNEYTSNRR